MAEDLKALKGMSEAEAKAILQLNANAKKRKRAEAEEIGRLQREKIAEHHDTTASDIAKSAAQTATFEFGDEAIGSVVAAYQKATGDDRPYSELYNEASQAVRQDVANARSDTPVGTFLTDVILPNPAKYLKYAKNAGKAGKIGTTIGKIGDKTQKMGPIQTGALYGAGYSEHNPITETEEFGQDVAVGGGVGAAMKGVGVVGNKIFGNPRNTEAKYLGMSSSGKANAEGDVLGLVKDTEKGTDILREVGFFQKTARDWDLKKGKFLPSGFNSDKVKFTPLQHMRPPSPREAVMKMKRGSRVIIKDIERKIREKSPAIMPNEFKDSLANPKGDAGKYMAAKPTSYAGTAGKNNIYVLDDLDKFQDGKLRDIIEDTAGDFRGEQGLIDDTVNGVIKKLENNQGAFTVEDAQKVKIELYKKLSDSYAKKDRTGVSDFKDVEEVTLKKVAGLLKDFVNDKVPSVKRDNEVLEAMLTYRGSINKKYAKQYYGNGEGGVLEKAANRSTLGGIIGMADSAYNYARPYTSKAGRMYEAAKTKGIPFARPYMEGAGSSFGGKVMGRMMGPDAIPMNERKPDSVSQQAMEVDKFGRSPNSIGRAIDGVAEEIKNTVLPRDSEAILKDPNIMLLKVAQQMPDKYDELKHIIEKRPDIFRKTFPMLVNMMPQAFELDEYNRVDGKIRDENLRKKAEQDLWKNEQIPVETKVLMNDELNKDGSFYMEDILANINMVDENLPEEMSSVSTPFRRGQ